MKRCGKTVRIFSFFAKSHFWMVLENETIIFRKIVKEVIQ